MKYRARIALFPDSEVITIFEMDRLKANPKGYEKRISYSFGIH